MSEIKKRAIISCISDKVGESLVLQGIWYQRDGRHKVWPGRWKALVNVFDTKVVTSERPIYDIITLNFRLKQMFMGLGKVSWESACQQSGKTPKGSLPNRDSCLFKNGCRHSDAVVMVSNTGEWKGLSIEQRISIKYSSYGKYQ